MAISLDPELRRTERVHPPACHAWGVADEVSWFHVQALPVDGIKWSEAPHAGPDVALLVSHYSAIGDTISCDALEKDYRATGIGATGLRASETEICL